LKKTSIVILGLFLLLSLNCSSVTSHKPVGVNDTEHASLFEGSWAHEDGIIFFRKLDDGKLVGAVVEWKEKKFCLETMELVVTKIGDTHLVNLLVNENKHLPAWYFGRYTFDEKFETMVVYPPNVEQFEKAISSGSLAGKLEKDKTSIEIYLESNKPDLMDLLLKEGSANYFDTEKVTILKRIGKYEQTK